VPTQAAFGGPDAGRLGGLTTSERKTQATMLNGKKGGRSRRTQVSSRAAVLRGPSNHHVQGNRFHTQLQRVLGSKVQTSTPRGSLAYQGIAIQGAQRPEIEVEDV
jgi:hypothetical protein